MSCSVENMYVIILLIRMYKKTPYMMSACPLKNSGHGAS